MQIQSENLSKRELRKLCIDVRRNVSSRSEKDNSICSLFLTSDMYKNARQLLCYMALPDEVSCDAVIQRAFNDKKRVAVPYCTNRDGDMEFYYISSFDDLTIGSYNIREPNPNKCPKVVNFGDSILLAPGVAFDKCGNRLGYGKGYYDRFLEKFTFNSVGLCYNTLVIDHINGDRHDVPVEYIITEFGITDCKNGGRNG